jgi:tetratricopeptide (TPR) repeat protein
MRSTIAAFVVVLAFTSASRAAAPDDRYGRIPRLERWLKDILRHAPGTPDAAVVDASEWSNSEIEMLRVDSLVLSQLMRNPRLTSFQMPEKDVECIDCLGARRELTQPRTLLAGGTIRYTDSQLHRLKVLACAAAGKLKDAYCREIQAEPEIDAELSRLAELAANERKKGDENYVLRLAALLHADVAMITAGALQPVTDSGPTAGQSVRVQTADGEATDIGTGDGHWTLGRSLLDEIKPGRDDMVRSWYVATSTWMQLVQQYNRVHLEHARKLFPGDATIAFLNGTHAEAYAGAAIQAVVKSAVLPTGFALKIGSSDAEMKTAETFLERSIRLDPSFDEAHLHLGRVLVARGKPQEAIIELQRAASATKDPLIQYYAAMFLGAAEEALSHDDAARVSYEHAAEVFPRAQSPYLALSALNATRGSRTAAIASIAPLFALPSNAEYRDDPWWRYPTLQGRRAGELLQALWAPFRTVER